MVFEHLASGLIGACGAVVSPRLPLVVWCGDGYEEHFCKLSLWVRVTVAVIKSARVLRYGHGWLHELTDVWLGLAFGSEHGTIELAISFWVWESHGGGRTHQRSKQWLMVALFGHKRTPSCA